MFGRAKQEIKPIENLSKKYLTVVEVSNLVSMSLSLKEILQQSVDYIVDKLGYESAVIYSNDPSENKIRSNTFTNKAINKVTTGLISKSFDSLFINYDQKNNLVVQSVLDRKIVQDSDLAKFITPVVTESLAKVLQVMSRTQYIISLPILYKEECLGAIMFTKAKKEPFDEDIDVLKLYTQQIAVAINNANLFNEKQKQLDLLTAKNKDLQSLFNLASNISKSLDPQEVAQISVDSLPQDDMMVGGALSKYDQSTGKVYVVTTTRNQLAYQIQKVIGDFSQYALDINDLNPDVQNNITLKVIRDAQPIFTDNLSDYMAPAVPKQFIGVISSILSIKSVAVYPVTSKGKVVGTIAFFIKGKLSAELGDNEKQLLATYANQIGIAYENANVYKLSQEIQMNLEKALKELEEVRQHERDMIDVMGHELRTPISIVRNALVMMDMQAKKDPNQPTSNVTNLLDMAVNSTRREVDLIETLLSATKAEGKGFQLVLEKINLLDVVNESIKGFQADADKKGLKLIYEAPKDPIYVYGDKTRTQEVADNFVSNAVKYTLKGSVEIKLSKDNELGYMAIKDTGIGIQDEDLKRLGEKFFRARQYIDERIPTQVNVTGKVGVVRPGGTGLGLFVTYSLIKVMHGKFKVDSEVGKGSTFTFGLPIYTNQPAQQVERKVDEEEQEKK